MVFTEQQLQVKKLVDVQQDIEIDALNDGVSALSSTMQNGFTEAANNFSDIQNSLESMNILSNERYNGVTGSVNTLSNAMTQGFLDMGNTVANVTGEIQGQLNQMNANTVNMNDNIQNQFNDVNIELQNIQNNFELVNTNIGGSINAYNDQITNSLSVDMLSANTLIYNVSATPVSSLTALGYDSNGRVIPVTVIANSNLQLPTSANYIYTDTVGTPFKGMADTVVSTNENLVTSYAVYNAVNDIWADLNEFHNEVSNSFGGIQNQFNEVNNNFNGIQSQFSDVNNSINDMNAGVQNQFSDVNITFGGIQNQFNDVNNSINDMNAGVQNQFSDVNITFDGIQNQFNDVNNNISDIDNTLYVVMDGLGINIPMNYINSSFPVDYKAVQTVVFTKGNIGNLWSESSLLGNKYYDWNSSTNTLTFSSPTGIIFLNSRMFNTFSRCTSLNQNIFISNSVTDMGYTFQECTSLNQNILIPNSVTAMYYTFSKCKNLNQNILIPNSVTNMGYTFSWCKNLNQNILIPNIVTNMDDTFLGCTILNQNILIPNSVTTMGYTFCDCNSLNQNIYLYSDKITLMSRAFKNCSLLSDKYIHIRSSIPLDTSNSIYNSLVNSNTGVDWTGRVVNDLPDPTTWPPAN